MIARSRLNKRSSYKNGLLAEYYAALYLVIKGYRVQAMRYKTKVGEIDLIARRGNCLVFIEVKFRPEMAQAVSAVLGNAQKRIRVPQSIIYSPKMKKNRLPWGMKSG